MNSAVQVRAMIEGWKSSGLYSKAEMAAKIAEACLEWPYVWGSLGEEDTVEKRQYYMNRSAIGEGDKELIRKRCQVLNGSSTECSGCKYFPNGFRTRMFDCRGFTRWVMGQVGITINGAGATSQYNDDSNWSRKGPISEMPADQVCCVFKYISSTGKMDHTGLHIGNGNIIHCSVEVKRGKTTERGWTHYAIPKGIDGKVVTKPTIRRGDEGPYVVECQQDLIKLGYDVGPTGADGKFGRRTETAVKAFQANSGLKADGIVGPRTWEALDAAVGPQPGPVTTLYTVHIPHLTEYQADALIASYAGAWKTAEGE